MKKAKEFLKEKIFKIAPVVLGKTNFINTASKLRKAVNLDLQQVKKCQSILYPQSNVISKSQWYEEIYKAYYTSADPNLLTPDDDIASVSSFVPYYKAFTSLVIYNFFRINYNIRSPILYRISIFKNSEFVWCKQVLLPSSNIVLIDDLTSEFIDLPENGTLVVEAFHPRILIKTRQLRFFVIYRDNVNGVISGTHSMPMNKYFSQLMEPSYRAYSPSYDECFYHSAMLNKLQLSVKSQNLNNLEKLSSEKLTTLGYMTSDSNTGCPGAIWHDTTSPHKSVLAKNKRELGSSVTVFYIPDFLKHAPMVLISKNQIGFLPKIIKVILKFEDGKLLAEKNIEIQFDNATVDIQSEFSDITTNLGVICLLEFDQDIGTFVCPPVAYVHVYYRSPNGPGDQVHSHSTTGFIDDPFQKYKSYRCRKFAPFIKDIDLEHIYCVINIGAGLKPSSDREIKIRLITDSGYETIIYKNLNPIGVTNFYADELFYELDSKIKKVAIIQFEHESTNFQCSWFITDKRTGNLAVDHFTGG